MEKVNFVNYKMIMNDKNKIKNVENKAKNAFQGDSDNETKNGIYLRDDHCDWGSSGMNEFTNEFGENNQYLISRVNQFKGKNKLAQKRR